MVKDCKWGIHLRVIHPISIATPQPYDYAVHNNRE